MTIRTHSAIGNTEQKNAEALRDALLRSAPELDSTEVELDIIPELLLPGGALDLVLIFQDRRSESELFRTKQGYPVHSFVMVIEAKRHSPDPDSIRFKGSHVQVRYGDEWHDASSQCDRHTFALKNFQKASSSREHKRDSTWVQRAVWLVCAPSHAFREPIPEGSVPILFADVTWGDLIARLEENRASQTIKTLVERATPRYHDNASLLDLLNREILPTKLDLKRINTLTQTRFDEDKTAYIRNLGDGLLILRGRGGTGKTFSLIQIAMHLARQGKRTTVLTYNHGLIADINRSLKFIQKRNPEIRPLPEVQTRYSFIQDVFTATFGIDAEKSIRQMSGLEERENARQTRLLASDEVAPSGYDYILVDEGQDWKNEQRDLLFKLVSPSRVVVADGVDQFVDASRCEWDRGDIAINRRHTLRSSRRTKGSTCQTVGEIARALGISEWDLEPDPGAYGGKFTVFVEPDPIRAIERGLEFQSRGRQELSSLRPIDDLICLPSSPMARGVNYPYLLEEWVKDSAEEVWRGYDPEDRRVYPLEQSQLRAVQYASCRGMEGWSTLCLALDQFFDFQLFKPEISPDAVRDQLREADGFLYSDEAAEKEIERRTWEYASNWLMIPLTRSIDHLVIHLADNNSRLGKMLANVSREIPGAMEWH